MIDLILPKCGCLLHSSRASMHPVRFNGEALLSQGHKEQKSAHASTLTMCEAGTRKQKIKNNAFFHPL